MTNASYRSFTGTAAENYQRNFVPAIATPASAGLLAAADLKAGERVLDVACGTGIIARLAAARVGPTGSVSAIDVASDMIDVAKATPAPTEPAIEWHVGDATSLPFDDEQYDVVTCQMGLMFVEDRTAAVAEMRRALVPGGRVVVFSMHDPAAVADLLRAAGLRDIDAHESTATFQLPAPAEFPWQYMDLTPMGPFVAQATEAARTAMELQVVEARETYVVEGATPLDQPMVIATGRR